MEFIRKARKGMPLPQVDERPTKLEKGEHLKNPKIPWVFPEKKKHGNQKDLSGILGGQ